MHQTNIGHFQYQCQNDGIALRSCSFACEHGMRPALHQRPGEYADGLAFLPFGQYGALSPHQCRPGDNLFPLIEEHLFTPLAGAQVQVKAASLCGP